MVQMNGRTILLAIGAVGALVAAPAAAETTGSGQNPAVVVSPPSVGNGVANGVAKPAGSPSVSNGVSNGIVKAPGSPSVGNGIANGVVKSSTVQQ